MIRDIKNQLAQAQIQHPSSAGEFGVARCEISPPLGIHARMWGSATHETAVGLHRPLTATVVVFRAETRRKPLVLASLDLGWWRSREDEWFLRKPLLDKYGLDESELLLHLTHTHSGPTISLHCEEKPGGDKIRPYLESVRGELDKAIEQAMATTLPGLLSWHTGRCQLACFRDQEDPQGSGAVVGYAPEVRADDTLLVGRVTDSSHKAVATLVNYACHPTTLGAKNRLISPDYVGAMREVVEQATQGAPCLFLNGAAGDLAPRRQYVGDVSVADQNGRQLGHAVLATLADMLPPNTALAFDGIEESAARLGRWKLIEHAANNTCRIQKWEVQLPLMPVEQLEQESLQLEGSDRATIERLERMILLRRNTVEAPTAPLPIWLWKLGDMVLVGLPAEMHSPFQISLRQKFPDCAVVVANIVNGTCAYLPPSGDFARDTYQCNTTLFQPGAHEIVLESCLSAIERLVYEGRMDSPMPAPHFARPQAESLITGDYR